MATLDEVLDSYKTYLGLRDPLLLDLFLRRLEDTPQAARAEAAVFALLLSQGCQPEVHEDPSDGGVDFVCAGGKFYVEVTNIHAEIAGDRSGLSATPIQGDVQWFDFLTPVLWKRVLKKTKQAAALQIPGLLAITSEHPAASLLFGEIGATQILVGETSIRIPLGDSEEEGGESTEYYRSAFVTSQGEPGQLTRRISGLLLVGAYYDELTVSGILNPAPSHHFNVHELPSVPFLRIAEWPSTGTITTEWVIGQKPRTRFPYECFVPTDEQLRSGSV